MKLPAEADSLLLRRLLEQCLVGVTVSAMEYIDVSWGGGSFRFPKSITAQAVSTILPVASGWHSYWRQSFPIKGIYTIPPPFSLIVTQPSCTTDEWPSCATEVSGTRL